MSEIRLVVFNNGQQIVGDFERVNDAINKVSIKKPVQLLMVPNKNATVPGETAMAFAPFLQYTEEWETGVPFSALDIMTVVVPARELVNHYNTTFGSGLVLPTGSLT